MCFVRIQMRRILKFVTIYESPCIVNSTAESLKKIKETEYVD